MTDTDLTEHVKTLSVRTMLWGLLWLVTTATFWVALIADIVNRWGEPLVVDIQTATVIWLVALGFKTIALSIMKKHAAHLRHHGGGA